MSSKSYRVLTLDLYPYHGHCNIILLIISLFVLFFTVIGSSEYVQMDPPAAYVCANSKIYNATEWYICQVDSFLTIRLMLNVNSTCS